MPERSERPTGLFAALRDVAARLWKPFFKPTKPPMFESGSPAPEGPYEGSSCVACMNSRTGFAVVRRVNEDGTFEIAFVEKKRPIFETWFGVTRAEIRFGDAARWPAIYERLFGGQATVSRPDVQEALPKLGVELDEGQFRQGWGSICSYWFDVKPEDAETHQFDRESAYKLFVYNGLTAERCEAGPESGTSAEHARFYWNQVRMGGREPSELARPVTLDDAFERTQGVALPSTLKRFLRRRGVGNVVFDAHPNGLSLREPTDDRWKLRRDMRKEGLDGDFSIVVMHHDDYEWAAVFDDGEEDARIYLNWDDWSEASLDDSPPHPVERWSLSAPTFGMFFWDLAQTGLCWHQATNYDGGRAVVKTDIGLERVS